jgi:signal transduction histidine kinase/ligand-binding sensor domain-containing protein
MHRVQINIDFNADRYLFQALAIFLMTLSFQPLSAGDKLLPVFNFNRLTMADGLPSNEIRSNIVTDQQGFVWIGTLNGLARYDGHTCKVYRNIPDDPYSISSNGVMYILLDSRGLLWFGTFDSGLSLYDAANDRFVNFLPRGKDSVLQGLKAILMIKEDYAGNIWSSSYENKVVLADLSGVTDVTSADSIAAHVRFQSFRLEGSNECVYMGDWDRENVLFGTGRGFFTYNLTSREISRLSLPPAPGLSLDSVWTMAFSWESPERLWIMTRSHGLFLFNRTSGTLSVFHNGLAGGKEPRDVPMTDAVIDRSGRLWITTETTLDLFDLPSGGYADYLSFPLAPPPHPYLVSVDRMGRFWVSTKEEGAYFLTPRSCRFPRYGLRGDDGRPRAMETVDKAGNGSVWVATEGKVTRLSLANLEVLQTVDLFKGDKPTYAGKGVLGSYADSTGNIWYGTWGLGLYKFEPDRGRVTNFRASDQLHGVNSNGDVCWSIAPGRDDSLWVAGYRDGLLQFDTRTNTFSRRLSVGRSPLVTITHVLMDQHGKLWISDEQKGVTILDQISNSVEQFTHEPDKRTSISHDRIRTIYQDPDGRIWIGAMDLDLWNPSDKSFTHFPDEAFKDFPDIIPLGTDGEKKLWINYYTRGLGILNPGTGKIADFDQSDGLCGNLHAMSLLPDGRVLLVGSGGMNIIPPGVISTQQPPPPLVITRISINDSVNVPPLSFSRAAPLQLKYDQDGLEFEFAAMDPGNGAMIEYRYRLEGVEHSWVRSNGRRYVRYTGLSPGDYVFRVKGTDTHNYWPEQEIALAVSIAPPWWQTWWFRLTVGGSFIGLLAFVYRREVTRLRKDKLMQQEFSRRQIESQEAERKRLASELHDGLGQDLLIASNELQQFLREDNGFKKDLEQAALLVQGTIQSVREISSNLHPHQLDRLGFYAALEAMTENLSHSAGLTIHRSCDKIDRLLPKETEIHVYRIIQEALSNVVRHASAKNVNVEVKKNEAMIEIKVSDDGEGFDAKKTLRHKTVHAPGEAVHGFGLSSMTERVRIIGGKIRIESVTGSGTTVYVTFPHS